MRQITRNRSLKFSKYVIEDKPRCIELLKELASYYDVEANKKLIKHILRLIERIERSSESFTSLQISTIRMSEKHHLKQLGQK